MNQFKIEDITKNVLIRNNVKKMRIRVRDLTVYDMISGYRAAYDYIKHEIRLDPKDAELPFILSHELSHAASYYLGLDREITTVKAMHIEETAADKVAILISDSPRSEVVLWHLKRIGVKYGRFGQIGLDRATQIYNFLTEQNLSVRDVRSRVFERMPELKELYNEKQRRYSMGIG